LKIINKVFPNYRTKESINNETTSYATAISTSSTKHTPVESRGQEANLNEIIKSGTSTQQSSLALNVTSSIITFKSALTT
jgi:hypothetical protein